MTPDPYPIFDILERHYPRGTRSRSRTTAGTCSEPTANGLRAAGRFASCT